MAGIGGIVSVQLLMARSLRPLDSMKEIGRARAYIFAGVRLQR